MESLGQYLKAIREEKNISAETVNRDIKLTLEQLTAIENNRLSALGNHGFSRAMVYTYIRYLEADEKIAMNLFDISWPPQKQSNFTPKRPIKEKKFLISINFIWIVAIILIVLVLSYIIWISYSKGFLQRPFNKGITKQDSTTTVTVKPLKVTKQDTIRIQLKKVANTAKQTSQSKENATHKKVYNEKANLADTTDYVEDLLFHNGESPFNPRF